MEVESNRESGTGRFDVAILPRTIMRTIIIECKHSRIVKDLYKDASEGARQIKENHYEEKIHQQGY